jgi:hypothetical protein
MLSSQPLISFNTPSRPLTVVFDAQTSTHVQGFPNLGDDHWLVNSPTGNNLQTELSMATLYKSQKTEEYDVPATSA